MLIGACGFGATGSSVVTDYLKEFDNIIVKDDLEFTYVSGLDSLLYLERAVMYPYNRTVDSIYAIKRFEDMVNRRKATFQKHGLSASDFEQSAKRFIDAITTTKWYWYDGRIKFRYRSKYFLHKIVQKHVIPKLEIKKGHRVNTWPKTEVKISVKPENFYDAAQKHVNELMLGMGLDQNKIIALDQPFSGNNPQACFPFYHDPYAVVVDRDPRDNYIFGKTKLLGKFCYYPIDTVEDYIAYYKAIRKNQPYQHPNERVLCIRFEDMIYEYDKTTAMLREFLHLPENPRPKSVFDPSLSMANTQVFKRYTQFADDVKKIEEALPEYCYDFSKYPEPDFSKKMFFGKSPLHEGFKKRYAEEGYVPQSK